MTVFVVMYDTVYEGEDLWGIFETRKAAQDFLNEKEPDTNRQSIWWSIKEMEVEKECKHSDSTNMKVAKDGE